MHSTAKHAKPTQKFLFKSLNEFPIQVKHDSDCDILELKCSTSSTPCPPPPSKKNQVGFFVLFLGGVWLATDSHLTW